MAYILWRVYRVLGTTVIDSSAQQWLIIWAFWTDSQQSELKSQSSTNTVCDYKFKNDETTLLLVATVSHCVIMVHTKDSILQWYGQTSNAWENNGALIIKQKYIMRTGDLGQTNQISNPRSVMYHVILESRRFTFLSFNFFICKEGQYYLPMDCWHDQMLHIKCLT